MREFLLFGMYMDLSPPSVEVVLTYETKERPPFSDHLQLLANIPFRSFRSSDLPFRQFQIFEKESLARHHRIRKSGNACCFGADGR